MQQIARKKCNACTTFFFFFFGCLTLSARDFVKMQGWWKLTKKTRTEDSKAPCKEGPWGREVWGWRWPLPLSNPVFWVWTFCLFSCSHLSLSTLLILRGHLLGLSGAGEGVELVCAPGGRAARGPHSPLHPTASPVPHLREGAHVFAGLVDTSKQLVISVCTQTGTFSLWIYMDSFFLLV